MSSLQKQRDNKSIKLKNPSQKSSFHQSSSYENKYSKQFADIQSDYNSSVAFQQNSKKYPKSPFLKKIKNRVVQEVNLNDFQKQIPSQHIKKQSLSNRFSHKKGRSMDFQLQRNSFKIKQGQIQTHQQIPLNQKIVINNKLIDFLKYRNSQSEMKDYQEFSKEYTKSKQIKISNTCNYKNNKCVENKKNNKKSKKSKPKLTFDDEEFIKLKKHSVTSKQSNKFPAQISSREIFRGIKGDFRSMDLNSNTKNKLSLRDKRLKRHSLQLQKNIQLPFPSKLNSLYSNTTSLFCSQTEIQPFREFNSYRIPTQELQNDINQIRKFQTLALSNKKTTKENYQERSMIKDLSEKMFSFEEKTEDIIKQYITRDVLNPQSQSLIILSGKSEEGQISRILELNQPKQEKRREQVVFQNDQKEKIEEVIKLVSETNSLGEEKKQLLLAKIRQIIPISKIGSKQIQKQPSIQLETNNQQNQQTPTQSLKSSLVQNQCIEILNIKLLDETLRERQKYLRERLQKELKRLQDRKQMAIQDFQSEKNRLKKWINSQIKQTNKTRIQLWKGFNFAKKVLDNKSQKDFKKDEMLRCVSQKILRNRKLKISQKVQKINQVQNKKPPTKQQTQLFEPFTEQIKLQSYSNKKIETQLIKQEFEAVLFSSQAKKENQSVQKSEQIQTNSFRKNYIFFDSAQKIDYNFDDTSPIPDSPQNYCINLDKNLLDQLSVDVLDRSSYDQNSDIILIEELSPTNKTKKLSNLTEQDKQDIVQFIFLDLCVEIEYQNQVDSKIIEKINLFIKKLKERAKRPRGFKTNPQAIREYLKNFISFLNRNNSFINKIHQEIQKQLGPTSIQILRYLHPITDRNDQQNEDIEPSVVLDIDLFQAFEKEYTDKAQIAHYYDDQTQEKRRKNFIRNSMHIHNKAIFDAFNEQLDKIRPFGQWGKPFQWKKVPKFQHQRTSIQKNKQILQCAQSTINMGHYMCGFMIDKQQFNLKDNFAITEADIQKIKSSRLTRLLTDYLEELQKLMFIDDQQVELLVAIQQFVFESLIKEMITFLQF